MDKLTEWLLEQAIPQMEGMGVSAVLEKREVAGKGNRIYDARIQLGYGATNEWRIVEAKTNVTPATLGAVQARLKGLDGKPLLVADYITPPLADRLRALDLEFVDAAGNAYLKLDNALIWVCGRRRPGIKPRQWPTGRAFEPSGLKVLFGLLCNPDDIDLAYRDLARKAGVAHGTVGWVIADLTARGFLMAHERRPRHRTLTRLRQLAQQWIEAYARRLRPTLLLARYRAEHMLNLLDTLKLAPGMLLGGEPAAARLTGYLKPETATIWAARVDPKFVLANRLTLDPVGKIEIMHKFWHFETPEADRAPDLLTYADLLAIGDARTIETAGKIEGLILDRFIG